jgi:alpha-tubulin suppressor-like RCC1 family protein
MRRALLICLVSVCLTPPDRGSNAPDTATRAVVMPKTIVSPVAGGRRVQAGTGNPMIAAGRMHTLLVKPDGTVWTWGFNDNGQLGDGTTTDSLHPLGISSPTDVRNVASSIADWAEHSLAVTGAGEVWAWGKNTHGQLGDGTTVRRLTPFAISSLSGMTSAKAGQEHSIALKNDGTVWSWGWNAFGQLGHHAYSDQWTPGQVSTLTGITAISTWSASNFALKSDGTVWGWGTDYQGELGDGGWNTNRPTPVQVLNLSSITAIGSGGLHGLALKSNGTIWSWGANANGQLGDGSYTGRNVPVQVSNLSGVTAIAGGDNHSLALKSDGTVWAWAEFARRTWRWHHDDAQHARPGEWPDKHCQHRRGRRLQRRGQQRWSGLWMGRQHQGTTRGLDVARSMDADCNQRRWIRVESGHARADCRSGHVQRPSDCDRDQPPERCRHALHRGRRRPDGK